MGIADLRKLLGVMLLYLSIPIIGKTQVLADTIRSSYHKYCAPVFKEKKVKKIYYTCVFPELSSMSPGPGRRKFTTADWIYDTVTISNNYDSNGYFTSHSEALQNGQVIKLVAYSYDIFGNINKVIEADNGKQKLFDYLSREFIYEKGQIKTIKKTRCESGDTINSKTTFFYSLGRLVQVIEISEHGDLLMSSFFDYPANGKYVKEENLEERGGCEVRTTYYYTFDKLLRINKVYGDYKYFRKRVKPIEQFSYDFEKESYIFENQIKRIERYN